MRCRAVVLLCFAFSAAVCGGGLYLMFTRWLEPTTLSVGLALYLAASHWIIVQPDYNDMGWFGGMMDNPFSWSDDYNRSLATLRLLLVPGKFISGSLLRMWTLLRNAPAGEPTGRG